MGRPAKRRIKKKKQQPEMSKILVPLLLWFLFIYTVIVLINFIITGNEPSTLTMSVFGAITGELGYLGMIKNAKIKKGVDYYDDTNGPIA